jgi:hypothetical protein
MTAELPPKRELPHVLRRLLDSTEQPDDSARNVIKDVVIKDVDGDGINISTDIPATIQNVDINGAANGIVIRGCTPGPKFKN